MMLSLGVSALFFVIAHEIGTRYSSEIFKHIKEITYFAFGFSVVSILIGLIQKQAGVHFEWASLIVLLGAAYHLWGMPWKPWMRFGLPAACLLISLIGLTAGRASSGILFMVFTASMLFYTYQQHNRSWKNVAVIPTVALIVLILIDLMHPNLILRGFEGIIIIYALVFRIIVYLHAIYHNSITDRMTGLYLRSTIVDYIEEFLKIRKNVYLLFIDIDHFKQVNDTLGHAQGDSVLKKTSAILLDHVKGIGVAGRMGGEEMVALVVEQDGYLVAENIRQDVEKNAGVTVSIGVAKAKEGMSTEDFINLADDAMYKAKKSGRNRVVYASLEANLDG
ncbi:GGDEF domain-containing protein [Bacillus sp. FSL K6-6540]|uniref:GGDEF domain-containing protein n=1 Tax=Bacillus sp. FSL K6-6540 TaxID=2921512 RepID=UPI0030F932A3